MLQLAASSTVSRERGLLPTHQAATATFSLSLVGLWPPGGSIPKPSGLLFKAEGEVSESPLELSPTAGEGSMRKAKCSGWVREKVPVSPTQMP